MIDNFVNKIIHGDAIEEMKKLPPKSVNLICIDPPYNIGKDEWDKLGFIKKGYGGFSEATVIDTHYYDWMEEIFIELSRVLKDNGSFFMFHNNFRILAELDKRIQQSSNFLFKNLIIWNKRFENSSKKGFLDGFIVRGGMNSFNKMCEYIVFYTFDNAYKLKQRREELGVKQTTISKEILSKTGKMTGWYSNIETGKNYPTHETIKPITKHLGLTHEDLVPKFYNQKTHHCVWNYDLDSKKLGHLTPKPVKLIENIILHTTDPNDIVLDCFGGSGTTALASRNLDRKFILIEKEEKYCDLSHQRLSQKGV